MVAVALPIRSSLAALALLAACAAPAADDPAARETLAWRAEREARLAAPDGYLALVGLHWLEEGESTLGADPANDVVLPEGRAPARVGVLRRSGSRVTLAPDGRVELEVDGAPAQGRAVDLASDAGGAPTRVALGPLVFWVIERGGEPALRVLDPDGPLRRAFRGCTWFPIDATWRVEGRFVPGLAAITVPTVRGPALREESPGVLELERGGRRWTLTVTGSSAEGLFVVFGDPTNGASTYAGGRFLVVPHPGPDGRVTADFNRAYHPPCAFSPFTTCPRPPAGNLLDVAVEAGERLPAPAP